MLQIISKTTFKKPYIQYFVPVAVLLLISKNNKYQKQIFHSFKKEGLISKHAKEENSINEIRKIIFSSPEAIMTIAGENETNAKRVIDEADRLEQYANDFQLFKRLRPFTLMPEYLSSLSLDELNKYDEFIKTKEQEESKLKYEETIKKVEEEEKAEKIKADIVKFKTDDNALNYSNILAKDTHGYNKQSVYFIPSAAMYILKQKGPEYLKETIDFYKKYKLIDKDAPYDVESLREIMIKSPNAIEKEMPHLDVLRTTANKLAQNAPNFIKANTKDDVADSSTEFSNSEYVNKLSVEQIEKLYAYDDSEIKPLKRISSIKIEETDPLEETQIYPSAPAEEILPSAPPEQDLLAKTLETHVPTETELSSSEKTETTTSFGYSTKRTRRSRSRSKKYYYATM